MPQPTCIPGLETPSLELSEAKFPIPNIPNLNPELMKYLSDMNSAYGNMFSQYNDSIKSMISSMKQNNNVVGDRLQSIYQYLFNPENVEFGDNITVKNINNYVPMPIATMVEPANLIWTVTGGHGTATIDLSSIVGAKSRMVVMTIRLDFLHGGGDPSQTIYFYYPSGVNSYLGFANYLGAGGSNDILTSMGIAWTNSAGGLKLDYQCSVAGSGTFSIYLIAYM